MTINWKTAVIAVLSIAIIAMVIAIVQSTVSAQPAIKTLPASPQGEWVVLNIGSPFNGQVGATPVDNDPYRAARKSEHTSYHYVVMYHTGTGKIRHVSWPAGKLFGKVDMFVAETP